MKIRIIIYFLLLLSLPVQLHAQTKRAFVIGLGEQQDKAWKKSMAIRMFRLFKRC